MLNFSKCLNVNIASFVYYGKTRWHSNFYAISEHVVHFRAIPESPSWLITRGRIKEAKQMLIKVAKFNKQQIPKILLSDEDSSFEGVATISGKKYTM